MEAIKKMNIKEMTKAIINDYDLVTNEDLMEIFINKLGKTTDKKIKKIEEFIFNHNDEKIKKVLFSYWRDLIEDYYIEKKIIKYNSKRATYYILYDEKKSCYTSNEKAKKYIIYDLLKTKTYMHYLYSDLIDSKGLKHLFNYLGKL